MEDKVGKLESMEAKIEYLTSMKCVHSQELQIIKTNQDVFNDKLETLRLGFNKIGALVNDCYTGLLELKQTLDNAIESLEEECEDGECEEEDCPACKEESKEWEKETLDRLAQKAREFKDLLNSMAKKK
jgi:hypothetical protein